MKFLLKLVAGLAALVLLAAAISFLLPDTYTVERTTVIKAKPETVFGLFGDLRRWKEWGSWFEKDPAMKVSYSEKTTGVGAWSSWESVSQGNGKMTYEVYEAPKRVAYKLEFPDMGMSSWGTLTLENLEGGSVKVTWVDAGELGMNPVYRWFGLFLDGMIGPDFEHGLQKMKTLAEKSAP